MLFTDYIKQLREDNNLMQKQVAASTKISIASYSHIESGKHFAKREHVLSIAKFFDIDADKLLSLWLADRVDKVLRNDKDKTTDVFNILNNSFNKE